MSKKRLIDATDLVRRVLEERDKIRTEVVERYSFGVSTPDRHGQAMRGGIRKALREIETSPTVYAVEVVRCNDCAHYETDTGFCYFHGHGMNWTDFCSRGMKKNAEVE